MSCQHIVYSRCCSAKLSVPTYLLILSTLTSQRRPHNLRDGKTKTTNKDHRVETGLRGSAAKTKIKEKRPSMKDMSRSAHGSNNNLRLYHALTLLPQVRFRHCQHLPTLQSCIWIHVHRCRYSQRCGRRIMLEGCRFLVPFPRTLVHYPHARASCIVRVGSRILKEKSVLRKWLQYGG